MTRLYLNHRYGGTVFDDVVEDEGLHRALTEGVLSGREAREIQSWLRPGKVDTGPDTWALAISLTAIIIAGEAGTIVGAGLNGLLWLVLLVQVLAAAVAIPRMRAEEDE
jgi:hypothetical protein